MAEDSNNQVHWKKSTFFIPSEITQLNQLLSRGLGP
jgi:hypothetical protein